jgi:hypothetical protein
MNFRGLSLVGSDQQNSWKVWYEAALLEVNPARLQERIEQARQAIQLQLDLIPQDATAERRALVDAFANLRALRREVSVSSQKVKPDPPRTDGEQNHL